ncbi:MAG: hypothetical protein AB8G26_06710 [Ilumatobacter sp.]
MSASSWTIVRRASTAGEFHALPIPEPATPQLWVHEVTRPALVLGSTQRDQVVDRAACDRAGVEVVRRRSGGGAVFLHPGEVVWVDVILPRGGPWWSDDVHVPMVWLGDRLERAFALAGHGSTRAVEEHRTSSKLSVHSAAMVTTENSPLICFDGIGPGELVTDNGSKAVGISQRRTRDAARMQCCWYTRYDPTALTELLVDAPDPADLRRIALIREEISRNVVESLLSVMDAAW